MRYGLLLTVLVLTGMQPSRGGPKLPTSPLIGRAAPDFRLTDTSGQFLTLSSLRGKTIVLDFWATWCPPCREELPIIDQLAQSFSNQPVAVLGINAAEDPDIVRRFLETNPLSYRILLTYDEDSPLRDYGVEAYPFIVLIDRNGIVTDAGSYPANKLEAVLRGNLQNLLARDYVSPGIKKPDRIEKAFAGVVYPDISVPAFQRPATPSAEELFLQASLDFRMNRLAPALHNVSSCLAARRDWIPALHLRALIYSRQGKDKDAIADCTTILSKSRAHAGIYALRARLFQEINQQDGALDDYWHEVTLDPQNAEGWLDVGRMYLAARKLDLARHAVNRAIEISPENTTAYQIRAQIEKLRGDWRAELSDMDRMLILEPSNPWAKTYRADVLLRLALPASAAAADDAYSVYSAALSHPIWDHTDDDSLLLISEDAGATYGGMSPTSCIEAPPEYKRQMNEVFADYAARGTSKAQLQPRFHLTRPYKLLNKAECDQFVNWRFRGTAPDPRLAQLFRQTPDLVRLSQVFFDKNHTVAIVLVSNYCGGLCGGEKWRVLVKRNGAWVDEEWVRCMTIS